MAAISTQKGRFKMPETASSETTRHLVARVRIATARMLLNDIVGYMGREDSAPGDYKGWIKGFRNIVTDLEIRQFCGEAAQKLIDDYVWETDSNLV